MLSRRHVLKGLAATGMAATTPVWAKTLHAAKPTQAGSALPSCDISIYQHETAGTEMVTLMNLTDTAARLDAITPIGLEQVNGSLMVRVNQLPQGTLTLQPGERLSFEVAAISHPDTASPRVPNVIAGHVQVRSDHPAFNGVIPVTVFDAQQA